MGTPKEHMAPTCTVVDGDDDDEEDWDRRHETRHYVKFVMEKHISRQLQSSHFEDHMSEVVSNSGECSMGNGCAFTPTNEMDLGLEASWSLRNDVEKVLLLLPHLNRKSKIVQATLAEIEEDIDVILSLQPGGDDNILCGEDEIALIKNKSGRSIKTENVGP